MDTESLRKYQHECIEHYVKLVSENSFPFDLVVLTARDSQQRQIFERQIEMKKLNHTIPLGLQFKVISDRKGTIGSGTATLHVLEDLVDHFGSLDNLSQKRILLIHCGGFSKRLPNHSTLGKVFAPLPFQVDGSMWSMLEMKLAMFCCVADGFESSKTGGIMVTCADDICIFDNEFVRSELSKMDPSGFVAFAHPSPVHIGENHGVFVLPENEIGSGGNVVCHCTNFLHKPTVSKMTDYNAIHNDVVFTDSSYFFFPDVTEILLTISANNPTIPFELDCYGDFLCPMGTKSDESYIGSNNTPKSALQKQLYSQLSKMKFRVLCCRPSKFYHIGTMKEYIEHFAININQNSFMYEINGQKNVVSYLDDQSEAIEDCNFMQTIVTGSGKRFEKRSVVENSNFSFSNSGQYMSFGSESIISNVDITEEEIVELCRDKNLPLEILRVPDRIYLQTIPVIHNEQRKFLTFVVGVEDDLKKKSQPRSISMFGVEFLADKSNDILSPSDMWSQEQIVNSECSIWDACLYPLTDAAQESVLYALAIAKASTMKIDNLNLRNVERISFGECLLECDTEFQLQRLFDLHDKVTVLDINRLFEKRHDVSLWASQRTHIFATLKRKMKSVPTNDFYQFLENGLCRSDMDALELMRMKRSIAYFINNSFLGYIPEERRSDHDAFTVRLVKESESVLRNLLCAPFFPAPSEDSCMYSVPRIIHGISNRKSQSVTVQLPVRINLAGGWTDTPPYCLTHGGTVLNMSLLVNNQHPVKATVSIYEADKPHFRFVIEDDEERLEDEVDNLMDLLSISPNELFGIHKSVTAFTLFPKLCSLSESERIALNLTKIYDHFFKHLSDRPVGIQILTKVSGIPRGSGLGTSSILIVAAAEALRQVLITDHVGHTVITSKYYDELLQSESKSHFHDMVNLGLAIEQVLTTGGGWQDQVGGMVSGLKLIESEPINLNNCDRYAVPALTYSITSIALRTDRLQEFNNRMLVVFTGKQRLAKNVLTNVVENHIVSIGRTNNTLSDLKTVTKEMFSNMRDFFMNDTHDEQQLELLGRHLTRVRDLNIELSMSTSHNMSPLFTRMQNMVYGTCMIGAGSGGFVLGILKPGFTKQVVMNHLLEEYPNVSLCEASLEQ